MATTVFDSNRKITEAHITWLIHIRVRSSLGFIFLTASLPVLVFSLSLHPDADTVEYKAAFDVWDPIMLSSRNPHACYPQNLNDDGKLHNGLTASLCSRAAPPQKHKLIAKRGENSIPLIKQIQQNAQNAISTNVSAGCHRRLLWALLLSFPRVQLCFQVSEICISCWNSSPVQTFRINFKHSTFVFLWLAALILKWC